jgi:hypothetical protein
MNKPYTFKIGQHVFYRAKNRPRGGRTGTFTIVGLHRQLDGMTLYRIKSGTNEHLAHEDELKRALMQPLSDE